MFNVRLGSWRVYSGTLPRVITPTPIISPTPIIYYTDPNYLTTQACRYGGERKWFLCPYCQRRCGVLIQASVDFVCRLCANLPYACQNETRYDRLARKHRKLRARIFDESQQWVAKRKGMHWRTFNDLHNVYKKTDAACYEEIVKMYSNRLSTTPIGA